MTIPPVSQLTFVQIWWLAIRPKTLGASISGPVTGIALALWDGHFRIMPALAALVVSMLLQIGSNLANDVFDYERGADTKERRGPLRVTSAGLLLPSQVKKGMGVVFGLAALLGLYLAVEAGWPVILIGAAAILSAVAYTGGPFPLGYFGLGDLFVLLFFGLAAVVGTVFVQENLVNPAAWGMAFPIGLLVVGILVVNNLRDMETDRIAGKHTLAVRLGEKYTRLEYLFCLAASYLIVLGLCLALILPWWAILTWLSLPLAWRLARMVLTLQGKPLNPALGGTGQLVLTFSLLFLLGMGIARFLIRS
jgi:1,4-dihydroxy-2-naphthoate polyprenyltransferase